MTLYGVFSRVQPVDADAFGRMAASLAHRVADIERCFQSGPCSLGVRLQSLGEAETRVGLQVPAKRGIVCAASARLDNRGDLVKTLGLHPGASSDPALIAEAYRRWGLDFPRHLLGDFAIALWDPLRRRLLLVRDAYGVRALYYAVTRAGVVFASQARALFAQGAVQPELSPLRMAQYLARDFGDARQTFFASVERLPPGHLLVADAEGVTRHRYFAFNPARRDEGRSSAEYREEFRERFMDAVRVRLSAKVPCGLLLSGGLDSAGLLAALRQLGAQRPIHCFTARFASFPQMDEGAYIALHERAGDLQLSELAADEQGPLADLDFLHEALDEPFHAPNLFVYAGLARLASRQSVPVLLDGLDGDTVVEHGFLLLNDLLHGGRLRRLARELHALHGRAGASYGELLLNFTLAPDAERLRQLLTRLGLMRFGYLSRAFAHDSGFTKYAAGEASRRLRAAHDFRSMHHAALTAPLMTFYLEVHDKLAAALGVDHRHPYFDRRLMEFCLAIPPEQRLFQGWDRVIQRRAFEGLVPDEIRLRQSKSVWTENFQRQLFGRHGEQIRALVESEQTPLAPFCDMTRLRRDARRLRESSRPDRVLDLWCAVTLGLWLERRRFLLPNGGGFGK